MASKKSSVLKGNINTTFSFALIAVFVLGTLLTVAYVGQQTKWFNQAAGPLPSRAQMNLNSSSDLLETINPDGTMGPATSYGNWSNTLPASQKGNLVFAVTDPAPESNQANPGKGKKPTETISEQPTTAPIPTESVSTPTTVTEIQHGQGNGPQSVTTLNFNIRKVEVHLSYLGKPSEKQAATPSASITQALMKDSGKETNHWETLNITQPFTIDLVELAKTKEFSKLGLTTLAAGKYTEIRLYVNSASATLADGTVVDLKIPGKNNIVRVVRPFSIIAGQTTQITMDFDAQHSVIKTGNSYILKPVVARIINQKKDQ